MKSIELNDKNKTVFENKIGTALLDFYAPWCASCKSAAPIIKKALAKTPELPVYRVNADDAPELAEKYGIMSIPTLVLTENAKSRKRISGVKNERQLLDFLGVYTER